MNRKRRSCFVGSPRTFGIEGDCSSGVDNDSQTQAFCLSLGSHGTADYLAVNGTVRGKIFQRALSRSRTLGAERSTDSLLPDGLTTHCLLVVSSVQ